MKKLEYDTYYLIVLLMSNIKNYDGLTRLNSFIKRANDSLDEAQREELAKALQRSFLPLFVKRERM